MTYHFTCPHCNAQVIVKYLSIGDKALCLACGEIIFVPPEAETFILPDQALHYTTRHCEQPYREAISMGFAPKP